jgi:hypothetical protein
MLAKNSVSGEGESGENWMEKQVHLIFKGLIFDEM